MPKRILFSATTNGTIATDRVLTLLRAHRMALLVSLDGTPEDNRLRPFISGKSSHHAVTRNLPKLLEFSPLVVVRSTFTPETLDLVRSVKHIISLGARVISLCPVLECDWASHRQHLQLAYAALADWFLEEVRGGRVPPLEATWGLLRQLDRVRRLGGSRPDRPCNVAHSLFSIDPDGNVLPCHRFLYRRQDWLGTVDSPELSPERWKYVHLESSDFAECRTCPAEPVCGGGCRAVALNNRRELDQAYEGFCVPMRAHASAVERIYDTMLREQNQLFFTALTSRRPLSGVLAELASAG